MKLRASGIWVDCEDLTAAAIADGRAGGGTPPSGEYPDASNTGHLNAPGYPGSLTPFSGTITSGTTYNYRSFDGADVGVLATPVNGVTFNGCRFWSNWVDGWNVKVAGYNITFNYCTFEPTDAPPNRVDYFDGYQYGILQDTQYVGGSMTVNHCNFRGFGNGMQISYSTQARPVVIQNSYFHDARTDNGGVDHTDGILSNNANLSYLVIDHNTIVSLGNTQGIALQSEPGDAGYDNITITNNYLSGFGYTVAIGENEPGDTNITFTDNVFGTDIQPANGPMQFLYDDDTWTTGNGHLWRRNTLNVKSYPSETSWNYTPTSDDGKFVYPNMTVSATDYAS